MNRSASRVLAVQLLLALSLGPGCQRRGAPAPAGAESGKKPDGPFVYWDGAPLLRADIVKRFGRFQRHELWQRAEELARKVLDNPALDEGLHGLAYWYLARVEARGILSGEATPQEAFALLQEAVKRGFRNPNEIGEAAELAPLHDIPEFTDLLGALRQESEKKVREGFRARADRRLEVASRIDSRPWSPEGVRPLDSEQDFRKLSRPQIVVVTRIHHDGFPKLLPLLDRIRESHGNRVPVSVAFYQDRLDDAGRVEQTRRYIEALRVQLPCVVIGREAYKSLLETLEERHRETCRLENTVAAFNPFQPLSIFLGANREPLYWTAGVAEEWQLEYLVGRFVETTGAARPPRQDAEGDAEGAGQPVEPPAAGAAPETPAGGKPEPEGEGDRAAGPPPATGGETAPGAAAESEGDPAPGTGSPAAPPGGASAGPGDAAGAPEEAPPGPETEEPGDGGGA